MQTQTQTQAQAHAREDWKRKICTMVDKLHDEDTLKWLFRVVVAAWTHNK